MVEAVEKRVVVHAPVKDCYEAWTRYERFPEFMSGVKEVRRMDGDRVFFHTDILGTEQEWVASVEERRNERIEWQSLRGAWSRGIVRFRPEGKDTVVRLHLEYAPVNGTASLRDAVPILSAQVEQDLQRFKDIVEDEAREDASGGDWNPEERAFLRQLRKGLGGSGFAG